MSEHTETKVYTQDPEQIVREAVSALSLIADFANLATIDNGYAVSDEAWDGIADLAERNRIALASVRDDWGRVRDGRD